MNIRTHIATALAVTSIAFVLSPAAEADNKDTKIVGPAMIQPDARIENPRALDEQRVTLPGQKTDNPDRIVGPAMISEQPTGVESPNALDKTDARKLDTHNRPDAIVGPAMDPSGAKSGKAKKRNNQWAKPRK